MDRVHKTIAGTHHTITRQQVLAEPARYDRDCPGNDDRGRRHTMQEASAGKQPAMDEGFRHLVDDLPRLLDELARSPARTWPDLGTLPKRGIYVFYENGNPIYVGRTNRMRARLADHGRPSSWRESATFAFLLAKRDAQAQGISLNRSRKEMEEDPDFAALFSEAKQRVRRMQIRVIGIDDQIVQTLFEVYASMALNTLEYNFFDTH